MSKPDSEDRPKLAVIRTGRTVHFKRARAQIRPLEIAYRSFRLCSDINDIGRCKNENDPILSWHFTFMIPFTISNHGPDTSEKYRPLSTYKISSLKRPIHTSKYLSPNMTVSEPKLALWGKTPFSDFYPQQAKAPKILNPGMSLF